MCKKSTQIQWKSIEIHREAHTISSHMLGEGDTWEEVLFASLWISEDFQWIWVDFLHVDSHLYLYYLQSIYGTKALTAKIAFVPNLMPFIFLLAVLILLFKFLSLIIGDFVSGV